MQLTTDYQERERKKSNHIFVRVRRRTKKQAKAHENTPYILDTTCTHTHPPPQSKYLGNVWCHELPLAPVLVLTLNGLDAVVAVRVE